MRTALLAGLSKATRVTTSTPLTLATTSATLTVEAETLDTLSA
jgi:hypothetical protein